MSKWHLALVTVFALSLPLAAQASRTPAKPTHTLPHHAAHASKLHKSTHRTAQLHHVLRTTG